MGISVKNGVIVLFIIPIFFMNVLTAYNKFLKISSKNNITAGILEVPSVFYEDFQLSFLENFVYNGNPENKA